MPSFLLNVPLLAQRNRADCLPICVEMVLGYYGRPIDPAWLRRILQTTPIGTPGFKVLNLATYGYRVTYAPATDERVLLQSLADGAPPIALVRTDSLSYWQVETAHAVVVTGMDDESVVINDPAFPIQQRIPRAQFLLAWSDFDYLYALVQPEEA